MIGTLKNHLIDDPGPLMNMILAKRSVSGYFRTIRKGGHVPLLTAFGVAAAIASAVVPEHAVVLIYHHVDTGTPPSTSTSPAVFADHLDLLEKQGCRVLPLDEVVAALRDPDVALPDDVVALTFDDGYRSVYTEAFPRLRARGWPFTVFVCPEAIDAGRGPACTWDELREMAAAGATIGCHGLRHDHLQRRRPGEDDAAWRTRLQSELSEARDRLAAEIGAAPTLLAYPYGEWSPELKELVTAQGWTAFGQESGPAGADSDFGALPRFPAAGVYADPQTLAPKLRTLPLPVRAVQPDDPRVTLPEGADAARRPDLRLVLAADGGPWTGVTAWEDGSRVPATVRTDTVFIPGDRRPEGRSRTNVTAPSAWAGRWYWYSHMWLVGEEYED